MDQDDDGLDAARLQFRDNRIHGVGLVFEFKARRTGRRNDAGSAFQREADEGNGNSIEFPDLVSRKDRLAGRRLDGGSRKVVEFRALERMRPLAFVDRVAAAVLHALQLVLALIEFVIADGSNRKPHHRHRFDRRLVMEHRRQKRARADQISGRNEDRVLVAVAKLFHQRRHLFGAAGGYSDLFGLVVGIGDLDPAGGRAKVAVEIVDREDSQVNGHRLGRGPRSRGSSSQRKCGEC